MEKLVEKYGFVFYFAHINKRFFCTRFSTRFSCMYDIHTRSYDIFYVLIMFLYILMPSRSCDLGRFIIARARLFVKGATYFFT